MDRPTPETMPPARMQKKNQPLAPAPSRRRKRLHQPSPGYLTQISSDPPSSASMAGGAVGRGTIKDNQAVDGNAGPSIDEKRIDVDGGDPASRVGHHVGQADERLHHGRFVQ